MTIRTMRRMDRWAGVPLCLLLTLLRRVQDRLCGRASGSGQCSRAGLRADRPMGPAPRILIVKLAEMGSTVLALPALARLRKLYPEARFHYLCFDENRTVLEVLPGVTWEGVHTIRTSSPQTVIADGLRALRRLRRLRIDIAIDLEIFSRASAAMTFLSGARTRVGFHRFRAEGANCGDLYTHRLTYSAHTHTAGAFLALAEATRADPGGTPLLKKPVRPPDRLARFEPSPQQRQAVLERLGQRGWPDDRSARIVILNANTSDLLALRRWPSDRFVELARRCLAHDDRIWIVLTGAPAEAPAIEQLAASIDHPRVISMAGQTTLPELITLYGLARVLITNDSGPVHFAALSPVQIISLFGPETPDLYRPLTDRNRSITAGLACSPCINVFNARDTACTDNQCMKAIRVDEVFEVFRGLYDEPAGDAHAGPS